MQTKHLVKATHVVTSGANDKKHVAKNAHEVEVWFKQLEEWLHFDSFKGSISETEFKK